MSNIDQTTVEKIAHLARIRVEAKDVEHVAHNLTNILHLIEQMNEVDTSQVEPLAHPLDMVQRLREDAVTETNQRDQLQTLAPLTEAGLYLVPTVIEQN